MSCSSSFSSKQKSTCIVEAPNTYGMYVHITGQNAIQDRKTPEHYRTLHPSTRKTRGHNRTVGTTIELRNPKPAKPVEPAKPVGGARTKCESSALEKHKTQKKKFTSVPSGSLRQQKGRDSGNTRRCLSHTAHARRKRHAAETASSL